jgi:hypothetical protein
MCKEHENHNENVQRTSVSHKENSIVFAFFNSTYRFESRFWGLPQFQRGKQKLFW